jgi:hypothetical protein
MSKRFGPFSQRSQFPERRLQLSLSRHRHPMPRQRIQLRRQPVSLSVAPLPNRLRLQTAIEVTPENLGEALITPSLIEKLALQRLPRDSGSILPLIRHSITATAQMIENPKPAQRNTRPLYVPADRLSGPFWTGGGLIAKSSGGDRRQPWLSPRSIDRFERHDNGRCRLGVDLVERSGDVSHGHRLSTRGLGQKG